jgi:hypothetical protein
VYNEIKDNTGKVVKTTAEVQASVSDLLRQLGTSTAFASRIAAECAAPGKAGNDLYNRLLQEVTSLPPPRPTAGPKPTQAAMDTAAQVMDQEAHLFSMRDTTKPGIDIAGEVVGGELVFMVRAVQKVTGDRGTLSGSYMFERMLAHFASQKTAIDVIQGNWTYESNLDLFNRLSRVGLAPEEAAAGTITGQWATRHGYTRMTDVVVEPLSASPGAYTKVTAKFRK